MRKTRILCIATLVAFAGAGQASAAGLLGILSGNKSGSIVIAPSVDVGGVLSGNKNNQTNLLNGVLSGNLTGILNGNGIGILNTTGGSDGKKKRH